jgi:geranylgeranylglycerol-phosphate geranylgeranyltransferase
VSVVAGYFMGNTGALIVIVVLIAFGILYDYKLKEYGILGNIYIAFTMAAPFLFSSMLFKGSEVLLVLSVIAFLVGLGRREGHHGRGGDALRDEDGSTVYGTNTAKYVAVPCTDRSAVRAIPFIFNIDPHSIEPVHAILVASQRWCCLICVDLLKSHDRRPSAAQGRPRF